MEDEAVAKKFGVPIGKGSTITWLIEGKEEKLTCGVTARRWTFVIDQDGKIAYKNTKGKCGQKQREYSGSCEKTQGIDCSNFGSRIDN